MHRLCKLIKNACNCLLSVSQALEREVHTSHECTFIKSTPDSCFVLLYTHHKCQVLCAMLFFGSKTVLEHFNFTELIAGLFTDSNVALKRYSSPEKPDQNHQIIKMLSNYPLISLFIEGYEHETP